MEMSETILRALTQAQDYLSGQQLSELLGVSRTTVWKEIGKLKEEGYEIRAVTNRGYRLVNHEETDILNRHEIEERLSTRWVGRNLIFSKKTGSTNEDIMRLADEGAPEGTLAVTMQQTAGKGRRGRTWVSPPGGNVYMSLLLRPDIPAGIAPMTTLIMALSSYDAVREICGPAAAYGIKWPNDLVVSTEGGPCKKFAGILTEMRMEDTRIRDVTIGIGININMDSVEEPFRESATTLRLALGHPVSRSALTAACWNHFEPDYETFLRAGNLAPLRRRYEDALVNRGRIVRVLDPGGEFSGTAKGITDSGELIIAPAEGGEDRLVGTGEISVRGVMGYV